MEIKDLTGLGQPITKLIEVVSNAVGTVYKPRQMRKEAEAEAYRAELLAKAEAKKILLEGEAKIDLLERAKKRLVYQELTKQENIEDIAEKSIKYLEQNVSDIPVDKDWRTRFFNKAQDISNEDLQEIWAKILADEVSNPGMISLRTLDVLSNLSKADANIFQNACSDLIGKALISPQNIFVHHIGSSRYQIRDLRHPDRKDFRFRQFLFTKAGQELCHIINTPLNQEYFNQLIKYREESGFELIKIEEEIILKYTV